jgi:hypothetical protein
MHRERPTLQLLKETYAVTCFGRDLTARASEREKGERETDRHREKEREREIFEERESVC